ncbi:hypothetical protein KC19_3G236300 [Ceratodon purpureus]|uniref:Uncharacterized protein n=1 Tax=Ceratodon purpureus TaxID=3225 RepID=A0A8T0IR11_CERPU|nr:hypothetical protein KC19_3G236300 [Ceratodon purpureus]
MNEVVQGHVMYLMQQTWRPSSCPLPPPNPTPSPRPRSPSKLCCSSEGRIIITTCARALFGHRVSARCTPLPRTLSSSSRVHVGSGSSAEVESRLVVSAGLRSFFRGLLPG